ncbi:MAG: hypothetical protein V1737_03520, partial [Chloroflexota bacterium]
MRKLIWLPIIAFIAALAVPLAGNYVGSAYRAPPGAAPRFDDITAPALAPGKALPAELKTRHGNMVVDLAHKNGFAPDELYQLLSLASQAGYDVSYPREEAAFKVKLEAADALLVALPTEDFKAGEIGLVRELLARGGRILLIGDPTRPSAINSLATTFGMFFEPGYLYNQKENDVNYRNVFLQQFRENELTQGLSRIALYTAGTISSTNGGIVLADENTLSSPYTGRPLSPAVFSADGKVLAVHDLTFLGPPYNAVADNAQFIVNIAAWLTGLPRIHRLGDFPHFLGTEIAVTYSDVSVLDKAITMKEYLVSVDKAPQVTEWIEGGFTSDTVFLGLLGDAKKVSSYLNQAGMSVSESKIEVERVGQVYKEGVSLVHL